MKLNVHLECFSISNDLLTEKTKCQVFFFFARDIGEKCWNKQNHPVKLIHYLLENALTDCFLISPTSCLD